LTSSPVLAERDAKSREKFFNYFGISCDFCRNDSNNNLLRKKGDMLECYKEDIVYGDGLSLIGDILRSEFLGKRGRGNRPFDYIIIDEIDNICIDNLRNIVELVDNFPGFKYLEYLYFFIYKVLTNKVNKLKKNHKKNYKEELRKKAELIIHEVSEETRIFLSNNKDLNYDDEKKNTYS
jgi:preprotein translocase subunit SecA